MTVLLPNYVLENKNNYQLIRDKNLLVSKSKTLKKDMMSLRNSMHIMILLINGSKILHLQDNDIKINTNDVLLLSQGNYFMSELVGDKNNFESIVVYFSDEFVLNFIKKYNIEIDSKEEVSILKFERNDLINSCVLNINKYFEDTIDNSANLVNLKIEEMFLYFLSKEKNSFIKLLTCILNTESSRIKYILENNIDIINSVDEMSKITRLSPKALRKEMNRLYNQNPKEWLDSQRLLKAQNLLKNSSNSISDIATTCGYSSVSWFINQFKKYYETTPSLYRSQYL